MEKYEYLTKSSTDEKGNVYISCAKYAECLKNGNRICCYDCPMFAKILCALHYYETIASDVIKEAEVNDGGTGANCDSSRACLASASEGGEGAAE